MARVKGAMMTRKRRNKVLKMAKGYWGAKSKHFKMAVGRSEVADFRLHFYNSDGSRGEMCGNGARCICKFAYDHGIAGEAMTVQTDAGLVPGWRISENLYRIHLNNPSILDLGRKGDIAYAEAALEDTIRYHGANRIDALYLHEVIGDLLARQGRFSEACERYTLALVTREKNLPADTAALARLEKKLTCAEEGKAHQIPEIIMWV